MFDLRRADRRRFLGTAGLALAGAWIGTRDPVLHMITSEPFRVSGARDLASLGRATAWLNSAPLTAADLRGKVVLVDFWTYTCINWLRTLPYVRAWAERYKEHGLSSGSISSFGSRSRSSIGRSRSSSSTLVSRRLRLRSADKSLDTFVL